MGNDLVISPLLSEFEKIKITENSWIARLAALKMKSPRIAMVLGNTIHLHNTSKQDFFNQEKWVKHEACHLRQFRKHGFLTFIFKYLVETFRSGYYNNKYEVEARLAEEKEGYENTNVR